MSNTLTVRLPDDLLKRLREKSRRTGLPMGQIARESLETTLDNEKEPVWMKYAGTMTGPRNLSLRKGYSRS
jgi:predicted DNA-binding protein